MIMEKSRIPAGLMDPNFEFFLYKGVVMVLSGGKIRAFESLPANDPVVLKVKHDMDNHPKAVDALGEMGITGSLDCMLTYIRCRYGNLDPSPDITVEGFSRAEYRDCGRRGECKHEGILCEKIQAPNGRFTSRELQVIQLLSEDLPNKLIADEMGVSIITVNTHIQNIHHKIGSHSKAGIVAYAARNNLI